LLRLPLASTSVRAAGEPVSVPVIISLTGSFALLGNTQKLALETLMKTVNDEGGIDKRPLQFVFRMTAPIRPRRCSSPTSSSAGRFR
jgi:ABC-type branched-subunit amino acid transport system substrate-binding protein